MRKAFLRWLHRKFCISVCVSTKWRVTVAAHAFRATPKIHRAGRGCLSWGGAHEAHSISNASAWTYSLSRAGRSTTRCYVAPSFITTSRRRISLQQLSRKLCVCRILHDLFIAILLLVLLLLFYFVCDALIESKWFAFFSRMYIQHASYLGIYIKRRRFFFSLLFFVMCMRVRVVNRSKAVA